MDVLQVMKRRCSVRQFQRRPVEHDKLVAVLEAARIAPSACNLQPWHFLVVRRCRRDCSDRAGLGQDFRGTGGRCGVRGSSGGVAPPRRQGPL